MDNNAFDEALRRVAAEEKLPYAGEAWTRMAARLDAHTEGKKNRGIVLPLPALRWVAAAAVIGFAVFAGWLIGQQNNDGAEPPVAVVRAPASLESAEQDTEKTAATADTETNVLAPAEGVPSSSAFPHTKATRPSTPQRRAEQTMSANVAQNTAVQSSPPTTVANVQPLAPDPQEPAKNEPPVADPAPRRKPQTEFAFLTPPDDAPKPTTRTTGFDVAGGYGYGGDVPAFSVGIAVRRPVSNRLQLEGALALVGSTPDPIGTTTKADRATGDAFNPTVSPGFGGSSTPSPQAIAAHQAAAAEAEYEDLRARQLFVQAAPVLMYRVAGGLSAGGGVDAQRRVSANPVARERLLNSFSGVSVPALPEWDFGLALRADYRITKRLRFGLQYRESLRATSGTGTKAAGRDYWLFQAGYRIR